MKHLGTALDLFLGGALALAAVGLAEHLRGARVELGEVRLASLEPAFAARLASLPDRVDLTYFVSPAEDMPSHMRRVERDVSDLLAAMEDAGRGRVHTQIVDPTSSPEREAFAARRQVTPVRVRHVSRDSWTEQQLWSTLTMSTGPRAPAAIAGLGPEHLPRLQALVAAHLDELQAPTRPVLALAAAPRFTRLREVLAEHGVLVEADLAAGAPVPEEADLLLWVGPREVPPAALREVDRFLARGGSLLVAGAEAEPRLLGEGDGQALVLAPTGYDAATLLGHLGLQPAPDLLLDERWRGLDDEVVPEGGTPRPAPWRITCIANNQDFQQMAVHFGATVLFETPTALRLDAQALAERGWRAEILGTTSERSWARPWTGTPIPRSELPARSDDNRPKEPLMVRLRHVDPWRGQVVLLAADTPFRDEAFDMPAAGHASLLRVLIQTLASADQRIQARAGIQRSQPLPELAPGQRALWRVATVLLLPAGLAVAAWLRRAERQRTPARGRGQRRLVLAATASGVVILALAGGLPGRVDLTADGRNLLHPSTVDLARRAAVVAADSAASGGGLGLELIVSGPTRLPPDLRAPVRRLRDLAADLGDRVPGLELSTLRPEDLDEAARQALVDGGVEPVTLTSHAEESTSVRTVWSAARLTAGGRSEVLAFPDAEAFEHAEFRLAFACWRLIHGRTPVVAVAADYQRLTAAEAHEEFQRKGLIPPQGSDAYDLARRALAAVDFRVARVEPNDPRLEGPVDALIWLQPRRSVVPMLSAFVEHLYRGGRALLAGQHFNLQARQYPGRDFEFVHWPQPQALDVDDLWLADLGVDLAREVLFDVLTLPIEDETRVAGEHRRDFRSTRSSLPFVIRAVGAHFDPHSPITRGLGDQAFIWASPIRLDPPRLASHGLAARPLISTTDQAWSYAWDGGFLPPALLEGPPAAPDERTRRVGSVALAVDLTGSFPWPSRSFAPDEEGELADAGPLPGGPPPYPRPEPVAEHAPGRLVLIGDSELFKSRRLVELRDEFRGDHLLLNATADLVLGEELSAVMARRPVARGFGDVAEAERLRWRALVLLALPGLVLAAGATRALAQRRRGAA